MKWRKLTEAAGISLITLLIIPITLEVGFRIFPAAIPFGACTFAPILGETYCQHFYRYDRPMKVGYTYKPGYTFSAPFNPADPAVIGVKNRTCGEIPDHTFDLNFQADRHGFLNEPRWQDEYDIVMTGDSFSQPFSQVFWVEELEAINGQDVLNLGMDGWGPLSEVEAVEQFGLDKNPEWVIVMYFEGNDQFNVGEYLRRDETGLNWRAYALNTVQPVDRLILPHVVHYWFAPPEQKETPSEEILCQFPMTVATKTNRFETIFFPVHIRALSSTADDLQSSREWQATTNALLNLHQQTEAQGAQLLVVYVPAKEHVYWGRVWDEVEVNEFLSYTEPLRTYAEFEEHIDDELVLMHEFTTTHQINFLNLTRPLYEQMLEGDDLYNFADVHWNDAGNRFVAEQIAAYMDDPSAFVAADVTIDRDADR